MQRFSNTTKKPIAYVSADGFVIPSPNFSSTTQRFMQGGRYIYTQKELQLAIAEQNRLQDERRELADKHYGSEAIQHPIFEGETAEDVIEYDMSTRPRETIPSFTASPNRKGSAGGKSKRVTTPNEKPLPDSLNQPQNGMNLTDEELDSAVGITPAQAVQAVFGGQVK